LWRWYARLWDCVSISGRACSKESNLLQKFVSCAEFDLDVPHNPDIIESKPTNES